MRKRLTLLGAIVFLAASLGLARASGPGAKTKSANSSWIGWITCSECGAKGANKRHADCAHKCFSTRGAKYVLYETTTKKMYDLSDQDMAGVNVAQRVEVTGTLEGNTIHIASIGPAPPEKK